MSAQSYCQIIVTRVLSSYHFSTLYNASYPRHERLIAISYQLLKNIDITEIILTIDNR